VQETHHVTLIVELAKL